MAAGRISVDDADPDSCRTSSSEAVDVPAEIPVEPSSAPHGSDSDNRWGSAAAALLHRDVGKHEPGLESTWASDD